MPFHTKYRFPCDPSWQVQVLSIAFKFIGLRFSPPLLLRPNSMVILNFPDAKCIYVLILWEFAFPPNTHLSVFLLGWNNNYWDSGINKKTNFGKPSGNRNVFHIQNSNKANCHALRVNNLVKGILLYILSPLNFSSTLPCEDFTISDFQIFDVPLRCN